MVHPVGSYYTNITVGCLHDTLRVVFLLEIQFKLLISSLVLGECGFMPTGK